MLPPGHTRPVRKAAVNRFASTAKTTITTGEVDCLNSALYSTKGAEELISTITARRIVHKLILGHNKLGDDGCVALFAFLGSAVGRRYPIAYISLNANDIGEQGFLAIADYIKDNQHLKQLLLQNNKLAGCASTFTTFVEAVNTSQLECLSLSTNRRLSDSFIEIFLPALKSLHLRELYVSGLNITPRSCPRVVDYLSSPTRCHLRSFICNGNGFGSRGVQSIVDAVRRHNHIISFVELYVNELSEGLLEDDGSPLQHDFDAWKASDALLSRILTRNKLLKHETERQALRLLRYARPLLLHTLTVPTVLSAATHVQGASPFFGLPAEIQQYILSFFGPTLSIAQRIRIFVYASTPSTLPPLLPHLISAATRGAAGRSIDSMSFLGHSAGMCNREHARASWLSTVQCDGYELEANEEPDGERVRWTIEMANMPLNARWCMREF